jgi:hypothetical protein
MHKSELYELGIRGNGIEPPATIYTTGKIYCFHASGHKLGLINVRLYLEVTNEN